MKDRQLSASDAPAQDNRILGIELLRFLSALAVLIFHYQHFALANDAQRSDFVPTQQPFYDLLWPAYAHGAYGVLMFWCISGFIFQWKYGATVASGRIGARTFALLRFSRLYPLHLATLLLVAALQIVYFSIHQAWFVYQHNDLPHFALQLLMAGNWGLQAGDSFNGPFWSVSIEVLVYAVFFVFARQLPDSVWIPAAMILVSALVQVLKLSAHPVFLCLLYFYLGCLTARACLAEVRVPSLRRVFTTLAATTVLVLLVLAVWRPVSLHRAMVLLAPALTYLCVRYFPVTRLASRWLSFAGNLTYSSYLLHVPVQLVIVLAWAAAGVSVPLQEPAFFLAFMVVTLLLSAWTYRYFEMPAQDYLRKRMLPRP